MGFFSSIGDFVSDAWDGVKDVVGGVVDTVSPILGPAGDVVSGILGSNATSSANSSNQAFAREQLQFQKDYIQNRLQWQVEDAKKAGLHPMVAAGISPTSFSPVSAQTSPISTDWIGEVGQSLSYAATKAKDRKQQAEAWEFTKALNSAQIEGVQLDNELKVMQIMSELARLNQTGPSAPSLTGKETLIEGQNDSSIKDFSILGKGAHRLFNIAMHGNSAVLVLNPDIADSVSESMVNNTIASIVREVETGQNPELIDEIISHFSKHIRKAIDKGEMRLASIPGSGSFRAVPVGPEESFERYNVFGIN